MPVQHAEPEQVTRLRRDALARRAAPVPSPPLDRIVRLRTGSATHRYHVGFAPVSPSSGSIWMGGAVSAGCSASSPPSTDAAPAGVASSL